MVSRCGHRGHWTRYWHAVKRTCRSQTSPSISAARTPILYTRRRLPEPRHGVALIMSTADTEAVQAHLEAISHAIGALLILDKAGWHTTRKLNPSRELTPITLPPACPELNSAENIRQYLRQTDLANRVLPDYTAILDAAGTPGGNFSPRPVALRQSHNAIGSPSVNLFEGCYKGLKMKRIHPALASRSEPSRRDGIFVSERPATQRVSTSE
jgi:hypothetical protein